MTQAISYSPRAMRGSTYLERIMAMADLEWRFTAGVVATELSSSYGAMVNVLSGLKGGTSAQREATDAVMVAAARARRIDRRLATLPAHHANVLRYRFDPTSWKSAHAVQAKGLFGQLAGVVVMRCQEGTEAERRAKAEGLLERALLAYVRVE